MSDKWAEYREKFCACKDASRLNSCKGLSNCSLRADDPERKTTAPVVERQPDAWLINGKALCFPSRNIEIKPEDVPLFRTPPELAELQATIARLEREAKNDLVAYKAVIERQNELREELKFERNIIDEQRAEIEQLKGGQGEAVGQWSDDDGVSWCDGNERSLQSARESGWKTRTLYTSQPAPVSVDIAQNSKRYEWIRSPNVGHCEISRVLFETISDDCNPPYRSLKCGKDLDVAIDACLDKVKELNQ